MKNHEGKEDEPLPPRSEMAKNLAKTAKDSLIGLFKTGKVLASQSEYNRRLEICVECKHCRSDMVCSLCGCKLLTKAHVQHAVCPSRKW